ncbi:MAG: SDR family oxidoreductase [Epsilonproteobacteria bacterium]|nr:SDR family oxidoreductase [Campylobacterota bacterium]
MQGIITGYSSGIGEAICKKLESKGIEVIKLKSRLNRVDKVEEEIKEITKKHNISFLINSAGIGIFEPLETISTKKIKEIIDINLLAPIILTKLLLPSLKKNKGTLINISSIEAIKASKYSSVYSASKAAIRHFSHSLFEEVRKSEVKVCSINPDLTNTPFFKNNNLKFQPKQQEAYYIDPQEIAQIVWMILTTKSVISDITIRPKKVGVEKR